MMTSNGMDDIVACIQTWGVYVVGW